MSASHDVLGVIASIDNTAKLSIDVDVMCTCVQTHATDVICP